MNQKNIGLPAINGILKYKEKLIALFKKQKNHSLKFLNLNQSTEVTNILHNL